jgi:hypothetical protein
MIAEITVMGKESSEQILQDSMNIMKVYAKIVPKIII